MSIFLTIVAAIVIFSVLVLIHEFGHFMAARSAGIRVEEFGFGFPPRIFKKKVGETTYTFNAIPFGGFVKLFGEDSSNKEVLTDKRSFASKSPWVRTKVILAGVFMNFVLAIVLLTIGFIFGIEPLLVTEQDLFSNLEQGNIVSSPGVFVRNLDEKAVGLGIQVGDQIVAINDNSILNSDNVEIFQKGGAKKDIDITVRSDKNNDERKLHIPLTGDDKTYGIHLKPYTEFPRLAILDVKPDSASAKAGIKVGDVIIKMNGEEVFYHGDFETLLAEASGVKFDLLRGNKIVKIDVDLPDPKKVVIADVFENSSALAAGMKKGDIIIEVDGAKVYKPEEVVDILKKNPGKEMKYKLSRANREIEIKAKSGEGNLLGIALSSVAPYINSEISIYRDSVLTSVTEIKKVTYGPFKAFSKAISETVRLTGLTVSAFTRMIKTIVSKFTVPDEIGGPVQIAYYTHTFVQEGFFALLRFTALLSLSLGVMNVLPIPALDGGRLLFIVIEVIFRRRVNANLEAIVHSIGFVLLMLLILLVTYSDIMKLF